MRLSVTSRRPGGVGKPPARLRGTMKNASTGQMRSSNPPPACGAGCAGVRRSRFGVWPHGKAHSARPAGFRMRFSVECAFPHLGKRRAASRKSAFCTLGLTEKRSLYVGPHGKVQFAPSTSRKGAVCTRAVAQSAPFREARPQAEVRGARRNPPRILAGGCSGAFAQLGHFP